jgi:hypothetical protein
MLEMLKDLTTHDFGYLSADPDGLAQAVRQVLWLKMCRLHK